MSEYTGRHNFVGFLAIFVVIFLAYGDKTTAEPLLKTISHGIYPGTRWCGKGNIAKDENDFGKLREVDMCCREHDRCAIKIKSNMTKYGLENKSPYTRLSCQCDDTFRRCLKNVPHSVNARAIKAMYFRFLKMPCFNAYSSITDCERRNIPVASFAPEDNIWCAEWAENIRNG